MFLRNAVVAAAALTSTFANAGETPAARILNDMDACFILYDAKAGEIVERHGGERCAQRNSPCSTFKVPLAVMGFDAEVLMDASTTFKWDGKPKMLKAWERDHDARSWMKDSVVWYSQEIARKLGKEKMAKYMRDFDYGNADMSGGLETAWLSDEPDPKSTVQPSIKVSADEQLKFFTKLWHNELPAKKRALELTQDITFWETSPKGYALNGKTGSGYAGKGTKRRLGWFVGRLAKNKEEYIGVVTFTDKQDPDLKAGYGGLQSRELFKKIVQEMGNW